MKDIRKHFYGSAVASFLCLILLIITSLYLPRLTPELQDQGLKQYGSLLLAAPYMGYVVIGILAFALGVSLTVLLMYWKKMRQKERERNDS